MDRFRSLSADDLYSNFMYDYDFLSYFFMEESNQVDDYGFFSYLFVEESNSTNMNASTVVEEFLNPEQVSDQILREDVKTKSEE